LFGKLLRKRGNLLASTLRSRDDEYKAQLVSSFADHALPKFENGDYAPVIDSEYPLEKVMSFL